MLTARNGALVGVIRHSAGERQSLSLFYEVKIYHGRVSNVIYCTVRKALEPFLPEIA